MITIAITLDQLWNVGSLQQDGFVLPAFVSVVRGEERPMDLVS